MGLVPTESLPLGFRFRPTDQELMSHYLRLKINGHHSDVQVIPEVDVCKWEPWDLPRLSVIKTDDPEWFFFCPRDRKYPNGHRSNRATDAGYWKATGKDRTIKSHKSSPSGRSDTQLIGMKKTLVFYRGRAPKGERTNWIMHEYRATEPELDGTASGQAAYVLCRLFHKPDEKAENFGFDEVEASGSSPITVKSSPDDTSSDLFQEPSILDIQVGKQPEGIKRWLTDKSDDLTANSVLHVENCTSDVEDHLAEASPTEVYPSLGGDPMSHDSNDGLDCQVFSPILLHKDTDTGCAGSPFADDFGSNQNGIHFQDGTSEQDVSLTELFDVLQNNGDYLCEESTSQTFSDVGKEILLSGHIECLHQGPAENYNLRDWGSFCKTDDDMVQEQVQRSPRSFQSQAAAHHIESSMSNMGVLDDHSAVKDVSSANDIIDPLYNDEKTRTCAAPVSSDGNLQGRTGIKIQKRQPRRSGLETLATQGTAARRIHLQMDSVPVSTCGGKSDNSSNFSYEEQEDQSVITQAAESAKTVLESDELAVGSIISDKRVTTQESNAGLGLRNKQGHEKDGPKRRSFVLWKPLPGFRGTSFLTGYAVSMYLVIVLLIVFVGMWKCPNFHALCI